MCNRDTFTYSVGALRHSLPGDGNSDVGVAWGTEKSSEIRCTSKQGLEEEVGFSRQTHRAGGLGVLARGTTPAKAGDVNEHVVFEGVMVHLLFCSLFMGI